LLDGNPVAGVSAVVDDLLQQDREPGAGIAMESAKEVADILDAGDVAEKLGDQKTFVIARLLESALVIFPIVVGGIASQGWGAGFIPGEVTGGWVRFGFAFANASAANEAVEGHG
jgi:hypothetical protein